jgi:phosphate/sulfate permease
MDFTPLIMWLGFGMSAYAVVGNDVIQTLGTFLTSNENDIKWGVLWLYAAAIATLVLTLGWFDPFDWYDYTRGVAYGRLDDFDMPQVYSWYYLIPPIVLILLTRFGIPVSTTFMILALFTLDQMPNDINEILSSMVDGNSMLGNMIQKSILGYLIAFVFAFVVFLTFSKLTERYFINNKLSPEERPIWITVQWGVTGFLWWQWLTQDLANIYIFLRGGDGKSSVIFFASLVLILVLLAFIFKRKGGAVQKVVREKINTTDIRSATFIDLIYGLSLYAFKDDYFGIWGAKIPMSTTWLFVGLLAGREIAIKIALEKKVSKATQKMVLRDLFKIILGLIISLLLVFLIKFLLVQE